MQIYISSNLFFTWCEKHFCIFALLIAIKIRSKATNLIVFTCVKELFVYEVLVADNGAEQINVVVRVNRIVASEEMAYFKSVC